MLDADRFRRRVKFSAWTFGDTVLGPVVPARVGDRIKFTMSNRSFAPEPSCLGP
jgi:nitrite reductase (NO-forming)